MFRTAGRSLLRHSATRPTLLLRQTTTASTTTSTARSLLTRAPKKRSGFKSATARWALAGGIVYWYATSNVFADEPKFFKEEAGRPPSDNDDRPPSLLPEKSLRSRRRSPSKSLDIEDDDPVSTSGATPIKAQHGGGIGESHALVTHLRDPEELEEDAGQEGAFNPETGEINWDCPCLGGMAHGPCGEEFKTAFSCFVFSTEEPKGGDCIDKFKGMQTCFQKYPEVYGSELDSDDNEEDDLDNLEVGGEDKPDSRPTTHTSPVTTAPDTPYDRAKSEPDTAARSNDSGAVPRGEPVAQTELSPEAVDPPTDNVAQSKPGNPRTLNAIPETELEGESKRS